MNLWNLIAAPINKIIDSVGDAIDKNTTNDEERMQQKAALAKIVSDAQLATQEAEAKYEAELTKRLEADMKSDSKLAKNVRPGALIFLLAVVALLALTDGNIKFDGYVFNIKTEYITLFRSLLMTAFGFYFGGRSLEKLMKVFKQ